jgi:hypothetical protein
MPNLHRFLAACALLLAAALPATSQPYVYWANYGTNTIGRANLDGTFPNQSFIIGANDPHGIVTTNSSDVLPVELTAFTATLDGTSARLDWTTASETGNSGFSVEHAAPNAGFSDAGWVAGQGTTLETSTYRFAVTGLAVGTHRFRLRQRDLDGATELSPVVELSVGMEAAAYLSVSPNPASDGSRVGVQVQRAQAVRVSVFDALGREVAILFDGTLGANEARSLTLDASTLPAGLYVVRLAGESVAQTHTLTVAR